MQTNSTVLKLSFVLLILVLFGAVFFYALQPGGSPENLPFILLAVFLVITVGAVGFSLWSARQRREGLQTFAQERGLIYAENDPALTAQLNESSRFQLFKRGRSRRSYNVLRGQHSGTPFTLFDYQFTTGSGKNRHIHRQTVILLTPRAAPAIAFSLRPQGFFDALAAKFGGKDINFPEQPEFSKKYRLQGEDEQAVRSLFNPAVMQFLAEQRNLAAEADGGELLVYRPGRVPDLPGLTELLDVATQLANHLGRSGPGYDPYAISSRS